MGWDVAGDVDYEFQGEIQVLPGSVSAWAGLSKRDPYFSEIDEETEKREVCLSMLNDKGVSFEEIAQLIEDKF